MAGQVISKIAAGGGTHLISHTFYGTCDTAGATVGKEVIINDPLITNAITLVNGMTMAVKFTNANSASSPTLTVYNNSGTAAAPTKGGTTLIATKSIIIYGTTAAGTSSTSSWRSGAMVLFVYDGTNWVESSSIDNNSTYSNVSLGNGYGICSVAATTTAKTATLTSYTLAANGRVSIRCTTSNTVSAPTMNINSRGAKAMFVNGAASSNSNPLFWDEGAILELVYDGTQYQVVNMPVSSAELNTLLDEL